MKRKIPRVSGDRCLIRDEDRPLSDGRGWCAGTAESSPERLGYVMDAGDEMPGTLAKPTDRHPKISKTTQLSW
jgi:hypothetical protein